MTRHQFLLAMAGAAIAQPTSPQKLLIVVAHPDDEYAFAGAVYRLVRELGWIADQVVITNGEAGYRYSTLAEIYYGVSLADEAGGRAHLPAIRKEEARAAGKILGIRRFDFLDQKDSGFTDGAASASTRNWDRPRIASFLADRLERERYDVILTLLPTAETHGHHREATTLALEAVAGLAPEHRPLVFGVEARSSLESRTRFAGLSPAPLTATVSADPMLSFNRNTSFGYRNALSYQIVVNWVIAEHKSQGLFQIESNRHNLEEFWLFSVSGADSGRSAQELRRQIEAGGKGQMLTTIR
jgi:LmbE family N-acetylglucosaminyl deacetylase